MKRINSKFRNKEYVDFGLPSGLKWAKCNVGAEKETDYGYYFMWGSTTPNTKTECTWKYAPFNNGSDLYAEEYFATHKSEWLDDNDNLKPEYDAAYKVTNGIARMPTHEDFQELLDNTINEWIEDFNGSRVNGRKFTGSNGNYIFIPASGGRSVSSFRSQGYDGYIWSSSLNASNPNYAWYLGFFSDYCGMGHYGRRCVGFVVRGVMD